MKQAVSQWWQKNQSTLYARELGVIVVVAANLLTRLVLRIIEPDNQDGLVPGGITLLVTLLVAAGWALRQVRGRRAQTLALYAIIPAATAGLLVGVLGPWVSGGDLVGFWLTVGRSLAAAVICYVGVALGLAAGIALEWDLRTKGLRAYAQKRRR